jgi:hypothetical protein
MRRLSSYLAALLLAVVACGDTTTTPPSQLNLDRPTDIAFGCYGGLRITDGRTTGLPTDEVTLSAMPASACDIRSGAHVTGTPVPVPPGQEDLTAAGGFPVGNATWFGFILQSGPGTVALASFSTKPATSFVGGDVAVLDADPLTPGKNGISVGEDPVALAVDAAGCKVVTANRGSCDMSVLDIASAVDGNPDTPIDVRRMTVTNAAGVPIHAKPAAMAGEPSSNVVGKACAATASGLVYVAYPSCHLVAAVDTSTGQIVNGIRYDAGVPTIVDGNVTCPDECGGAAVTTDTRPVALDLFQEPRVTDVNGDHARRLVIGSDNSASFTIVELDPKTTRPLSLSQIALEKTTTGNFGISQLVLTPVIGMGGAIHVINDDTAAGGQSQYVYAITTDNTIRVADVLSIRKECDTQVDPRYIRDIRSVKTLSCFPVGDPLTPQRRAGAIGPGIQLNTDGIPTSVAIIKSEPIDGDARLDQDPTKLIGYFAFVTAANGATFVVNVDDDDAPDLFDVAHPVSTPLPDLIAHQLRDGIPDRGELATSVVDGVTKPLCDDAGPIDSSGNPFGGPRSTTPPTRGVPSGSFAAEKVTQLPILRQLKCEGSDETKAISEVVFAAPEDVRDRVFPDIKGLRGDETWTLTWEGTLSNDKSSSDIDGPAIRQSEVFVDNSSAMRIVDQTRPFCDAGVEQFDIVQMRGCDPAFGNVDCPIGYSCFVHPNSLVSGLGACMLEDEADRLADACKEFLTSLRRYTVGRSESGELALLPRRTVLRTTPVEGCVDDNQCKVLADYAVKTTSSQPPVDDTSPADTHTWKCEADAARAPVPTGKRCEMHCNITQDCFAGTVCEGAVAGNDMSGHCMEGVIPPQACVNAPQRYEMRASEAFAVLGTQTGFVHSTIADTNGKCFRNPAASPLLVGRIPLVAPACDPTADPISGKKPDGTFEPNPCSLTTATTDVSPLYLPGTCTLDNPATELRERQAPAIRFRNLGMNLTIVDPYYPGDQTCILDRLGGLGNIPHVFTGYQLAFHLIGGFSPIIAPITPSFPIKVVRGPTQSIWVMDEGDFLSTSISQPSTRGKVFRMEPHALGLVNLLQ